jgi:hypothetical protein
MAASKPKGKMPMKPAADEKDPKAKAKGKMPYFLMNAKNKGK